MEELQKITNENHSEGLDIQELELQLGRQDLYSLENP